jgi:hypothetical protein
VDFGFLDGDIKMCLPDFFFLHILSLVANKFWLEIQILIKIQREMVTFGTANNLKDCDESKILSLVCVA